MRLLPKIADEIQDYTDLGIEIRYLAFPRAGVGSASFQKYVSAFCSSDNKQSLTDAKAGREISTLNCENPIAARYDLGRMLGVLDALINFDSGQMVPIYVPAVVGPPTRPVNTPLNSGILGDSFNRSPEGLMNTDFQRISRLPPMFSTLSVRCVRKHERGARTSST